METASLLSPAVTTADYTATAKTTSKARLQSELLQQAQEAWSDGADQAAFSPEAMLMQSVSSGMLKPPQWVSSEYQLQPDSPETEANLKDAQHVMAAYMATVQAYGTDNLENNPEAKAMFQQELASARSLKTSSSTYTRNALLEGGG